MSMRGGTDYPSSRVVWLARDRDGLYSLRGTGGRVIAGYWCREWEAVTGCEIPEGHRIRVRLNVERWGQIGRIPDQTPTPPPPDEWVVDETAPLIAGRGLSAEEPPAIELDPIPELMRRQDRDREYMLEQLAAAMSQINARLARLEEARRG